MTDRAGADGSVAAEQLGVAEITAWLREAAAVVRAQQARLTNLDAAIGDGDHGLNMARGFDAVERLLSFPDHAMTPGDLLPPEDGARATIPLIARKGRAAFLGERSIGHQDPGATSVALVLRALAGTICAARPRGDG